MQFLPQDQLESIIGAHRNLQQFRNLRLTSNALLRACTDGFKFKDMVNISITVTNKQTKLTKEIAILNGVFRKSILVVAQATFEPMPYDSESDSDEDEYDYDFIIKDDGTPIKPDECKNREYHGVITFCASGKMRFTPHWIQAKPCYRWSVASERFRTCSKTAHPTSHIVLPGVQEHTLMFNTKPFNREVPTDIYA